MPDAFLANSLHTYTTKVRETFHDRGKNGEDPRCPDNQLVGDFTLQNWTPSPQMRLADFQNMIDFPVIELARGVDLSRLPMGEGRGLLTRVVEEVIRTNDHNLMLSEVQDYVVANGLDVGVSPLPGDADLRAERRHRDTLLADRQRILVDALSRGLNFN